MRSYGKPSACRGRRIAGIATAVLAAAATPEVDALAVPTSRAPSAAFCPPSAIVRGASTTTLRMTKFDDDPLAESSETGPACWNPQLRREIASLASLGAAETAWLAYDKIWGDGVAASAICGANAANPANGCGSVLDGPYSVIDLAGTAVPLSAIGFGAYALVVVLALEPLLFGSAKSSDVNVDEDELDVTNRLLLVALTTVMATFSAFLMGLLLGVIHASCPFCFVSAGLSLTLGSIAWFSDMIPASKTKEGARLGLGGFLTSTATALALFVSVETGMGNDLNGANSFTASVVANAASRQQQQDLPPPPVTTHSTERTLKLALDLEALDTRFFGAYWCSHCYEQKEAMGLEAMRGIPYIECAKEGLNSQRDLCQERKVPGYPTWEVGGKLYPGEMELDELEDMVKESRERLAKAKAAAQ